MRAVKGDPSPMFATFRLEGLEFMALNGGPHFKFTPAISFFVNCKTQKEIDYYWKKAFSRRQDLLKNAHSGH